MKITPCLVICGGILLAGGLCATLISNKYVADVMGATNLGMAVWASDPQSAEYRGKVRKRKLADRWFYGGLIATFLGILLQTIGAVI